jgi:S1-C subfamily serine protease
VLLDLAQRPDRPKFQQLKNAESTASVGATRVGSGVYLGSRPSYADSQNDEGVVLEGVTEGSPAEKAGLKGGDRIIRFAGKDVKNIEGYMEAMSGSKPGDSVEIVVVRDGKDVTVKATLGTRPSRSSQN